MSEYNYRITLAVPEAVMPIANKLSLHNKHAKPQFGAFLWVKFE